MPSEPGFAHFSVPPSLCASVNLPHPSELSLLRGSAPRAPTSPDTLAQHLSCRNHCSKLSCPSERRLLGPCPSSHAHTLTGCLKFYYWFPLPSPPPPFTEEGRETDPLHIFVHQAASLRSPPLIGNPGAGLSVPFPAGLATPESASLTLNVAVQGDHACPLWAAERRIVDVVGQGGGEARRGCPRGWHWVLRCMLFMTRSAVLKPYLERQPLYSQ